MFNVQSRLTVLVASPAITLKYNSKSFINKNNTEKRVNNFNRNTTKNMPKPKGKGGKNRRRGKGDGEEAKRELEFKEEGQEYAQVVKMLGNGRCECFCFDGVTRLGHIRGKMRKKVWVTAGDIVLVGKRDFQDEKVDILHKYTADEARNLKQYGELPETARINETAVDLAMTGDGDDDDIGIDFDDI